MPDERPVSNLWQCSTSLFSLTCFYELSNQAFLTTSALLLDIPVPHALYLRATQPNYTTTDVWADALLNKSAHANYVMLQIPEVQHMLFLHKNLQK